MQRASAAGCAARRRGRAAAARAVRVDDRGRRAAAGPGPRGRPARGACPAAGAGTWRSAARIGHATDSSPRRGVTTSPVTPDVVAEVDGRRVQRDRRGRRGRASVCRSPVPSRSVAKHSPPWSRTSITRPATATVLARCRCPAAGRRAARAPPRSRAVRGVAHRVRVDALGAQPVQLRQADPDLLRQVGTAAGSGRHRRGPCAGGRRHVPTAAAGRRHRRQQGRPQRRARATKPSATADGEPDPGQVPALREAEVSAAPTRGRYLALDR